MNYDGVLENWSGYDGLYVIYKNKEWYISHHMMEYLGKEIEMKKSNSFISYTHIDKNFYHWHELWFEPEEFIDESEFKI